MSAYFITNLMFWVISFLAMVSLAKQDLEMVQLAQSMVLQAKNWAYSSSLNESNGSCEGGLSYNIDTFLGRPRYRGSGHHSRLSNKKHYYDQVKMAMVDCAKLYDQAEPRLTRLLEHGGNFSHEDALAWLSGVITNHRTCLDGLKEIQADEEVHHPMSQNLTKALYEALALGAKKQGFWSKHKGAQRIPKGEPFLEKLTSWNPARSRADIVVAKDGSGDYQTIRKAVDALEKVQDIGKRRVTVYVKSGVYEEIVEISRHLENVMFIGDGMDKTVITGRRNVVDGSTTVTSATFQVFGDGFWAREMTFENTAGPKKHQAAALMVASDHSLFYQCSFRGYQDTLYVHSMRQFYRDCHIYGTIDFIFGNAAVVLQNCDIFVRKPLPYQANMITAQGRADPNENTGISIHGSRIRPAPEFVGHTQSFKNFLGRPWRKYSRTIVSTTDLGGLIHPKGWTTWDGNFALNTLYYAEYMNTGVGASTQDRVKWPGFHMLHKLKEVNLFMVRNFIQGDSWIMKTGVPVWLEMT